MRYVRTALLTFAALTFVFDDIADARGCEVIKDTENSNKVFFGGRKLGFTMLEDRGRMYPAGEPHEKLYLPGTSDAIGYVLLRNGYVYRKTSIAPNLQPLLGKAQTTCEAFGLLLGRNYTSRNSGRGSKQYARLSPNYRCSVKNGKVTVNDNHAGTFMGAEGDFTVEAEPFLAKNHPRSMTIGRVKNGIIFAIDGVEFGEAESGCQVFYVLFEHARQQSLRTGTEYNKKYGPLEKWW